MKAFRSGSRRKKSALLWHQGLDDPSTSSQGFLDIMIRKTKDSTKILMTQRGSKGWSQNTINSLGVREQKQHVVAN